MAACLLGFLIPLSSCKKDSEQLSSQGEITLSSETYGSQPYYSIGYSFEYQQFYDRISTGSEIDIYLNEIINPKGELLAVQFSTNTVAETTYGFYLNAEFTNLSESEEYYNNYKKAEFPPSEYVTLTDTIREYQVYTFKTWKSHYVKFLVKDIRTVEKDGQASYMTVDIKYFIQRDGTDNLAD